MGIKQSRILGLSRYFLYNEKVKNSNKYINVLLPELYKTVSKTRHSIYYINEIIKTEKTDSDRKFCIYYKLKDEKDPFVDKYIEKKVNYEAKNKSDMIEIISRLNYTIVRYWYTYRQIGRASCRERVYVLV